MVTIKIDTRQLANLRDKLVGIKNGVPKVLAPAINRALESGRTVLKRQIREEYLIKAKDIPTRIKRANYGSLGGEIVVEQGMLPLNKFRYSPQFAPHGRMRRQLTVQVKRRGTGKVIRGGFIATASGYSGPFMRATGAGRLPIYRLLTIGAPIMATQPAVGPAVNKAMGDTLAKRIDHELERVLSKKGK